MAERKKGKIGIDSFISWGATIVIIGLMFKLQHWAWGDWMIVIGLGTEAVLFLLLGFQAIGSESVAEEGAQVVQVQSTGHTVALDSMFKNADISPEMINDLGIGLRSFSDKVASISNLADASIATSEFADKLKSASSGFDKLNIAFEKASSDLAHIGNSKIDTNSYFEQIHKLSTNLESLNTIYETELRESSSNLKSMNKHYENIANTLTSLNDSAEESKLFKEQVKHLNNNLASLNAVYGNMLSAMNQPRSN